MSYPLHLFLLFITLIFTSACTTTSDVNIEINKTRSEKPSKSSEDKPKDVYVPRTFIGVEALTVEDENFNDIPDFADFEATNPFHLQIVEFDKRADPKQSFFTFIYDESSPTEIQTIIDGDRTIYLPREGVTRLWSVDGDQDRSAQEIDNGGHYIKSGKRYAEKYFSINEDDNIGIYVEFVKLGTSDIEVSWDNDLDDNMIPPSVFIIRDASAKEINSTHFSRLGTKLYDSVVASDLVLANDLLSKGASPNFRVDREPLVIRAIQSNNITMVKLLLKAGAKINIVGKTGRTPLFVAVEYGYNDIVLLLLSKNIDFSDRYKTNNDAMILAAEENNIALARKLQKKGADFSKADDQYGYAAIKKSLDNKNYKGLASLFKFGANPDASKGESLLLSVVKNGSEEQTLLLLKNGLNPNKSNKDKPGFVLSQAVTRKYDLIVELLLKYGANPNYNGRYGVSLLNSAVRSDSEKQVLLLLEAGANTESTDDYGNTPLLRELSKFEIHRNQKIGKKDLSIVRNLLKYHADVNVKNRDNHSALSLAQKSNNVQLLDLILKAGADPFMKLMGESSHISIAIKEGRLKQVIHYLENDTTNRIQSLNHDKVITTIGDSLKSRYYKNKDIELVYPMQLLLSKKISPYEENLLGKSLVDYAADANKYNLLIMMDEKRKYSERYAELQKASLYKDLLIAIQKGEVGKVRFYIRLGVLEKIQLSKTAMINKPDQLLFIAIQYSNKKMLQLLLHEGLRPNVQHQLLDYSLLEYAKIKKNQSIINIVVHALADVNYVETLGGSSLFNKVSKEINTVYSNEAVDVIWDVATKYSPTMQHISATYQGARFLDYVIKTYADVNQESEYHLPLIAASAYGEKTDLYELLKRGAEVNKIDPHSGQTALMTAVIFGHINTVKILLKAGSDSTIKSKEGLTAADYAFKGKRNEILKLLGIANVYKEKTVNTHDDVEKIAGSWSYTGKNRIQCNIKITGQKLIHNCPFLSSQIYSLKYDELGVYVNSNNKEHIHGVHRLKVIPSSVLVLQGKQSNYAFTKTP